MKSGTTSLHRYLESHPQLYLLPEKEVPYFTNEEYRARGWEWYANEFFAQAPLGKLWGKSTPQYMAHPGTGIPQKIRGEMGQVKLIALLRNPVERAYSHYKMEVKREEEKRTFIKAIDETLQSADSEVDSLKRYVALGEYGRILEDYLQTFPREQLLVLFAEDLKKEPGATLKRVLNFLNVDASFVPRNLGRLYHVGGTRRRIPVDEHDLAKHGLFRKFLKLVPRRSRRFFERRFLFWFMIWNTSPDSPDQQMPLEARERLIEFYREDACRLRGILNQPLPWPELSDVKAKPGFVG
ncbi:MAG: sulfotransferase [Pedosphaera sp.]|nr:sulfotransferase [Pedosphaera sp.]